MSYNHAATQMRWHNDWNINALDEGLGRKTRAAQRLSCATGHQNPGTLERQMKQLSLVTATRCGNKKGHPNPFLEKRQSTERRDSSRQKEGFFQPSTRSRRSTNTQSGCNDNILFDCSHRAQFGVSIAADTKNIGVVMSSLGSDPHGQKGTDIVYNGGLLTTVYFSNVLDYRR